MIRLAVFDIDRTLISPEVGKIAPETVAALEQLRNKGVRTAIASGRLFSFLQEELLELGFDYFIMSNGAYVADAAGRVIAQDGIDETLVDRLVQEMIRRDHPIDIRYCMGRRSGNPNCSVVERMQSHWQRKKMKIKPPKAFLDEYLPREGERPISCDAYIPAEELEEMIRLFPGLDFLPVFESPMCDINAAGVSKASGLERVCAIAGIGMEETIAFGDDRNDLEMIAAAGIGVAMGNGLQAVRDAADYVTVPCEELGVVKALRHFGLLDQE